MNLEEYRDKLCEFIDTVQIKDDFVAIDQLSDNLRVRVKAYVYEHWNRFDAGIKILSKVVKDGCSIHEVGSPYPFFSYYFYLNNKCKVLCSDFYDRGWKIDDNLESRRINLCRVEYLPAADIVICSEVLEHLSCNLFKLRDILLSSCRYCLMTLPNGNVGVDIPLNKCSRDDEFDKVHSHLREFYGRIGDYLEGCNVIFNYRVDTESYKGIEMVLLKGGL